jgi:hypothetical protein
LGKKAVFRFLKSQKKVSATDDYSNEWLRLRNAYADPAIELAKTKQALIVSAASVLDRLWNGNGGGGWDESCEDDYIAPLREHLATDAMFSDEERLIILRKLDEVVASGSTNLSIDPNDEDAGFEPAGSQVDYIVQRTIEWCRRHPDEIPIAEEDEYRGHD